LPQAILEKIKSSLSEAAKKVRSHRLFAKTKEARIETTQKLQDLSQKLLGHLGNLISGIEVQGHKVRGMGLRALNNLAENYHNMSQMMPQILHWIKTGKVVKGKIISLFNVDFRAIKRGKVGKKIEFGFKWGINQIRGGYVSIFMHSNMMSHDANYAVLGVKEHIRIFGEVPEDFGFDRAAWSADHKEEIRALGVENVAIAPKGKAQWEVKDQIKTKMVCERAQVEGKIGTMKRYGLNKSEARIPSRVRMSAIRSCLQFNLRRLAKDIRLTEMNLKTVDAI
jgi:transposase, IS5 family